MLVVFSMLLSIFFIGFVVYGIFGLVGLNVLLLWLLLFGVLILLIDLVVVFDLFKWVVVFKCIEILIVGESFFNDGVGVVIFFVIVGMVGIGYSYGIGSVVGVLELFGCEVFGGMVFGVLLGVIGFLMLCEIE